VPISLNGDLTHFDTYNAVITVLPDSNCDPEKLTTIMLTGVTATLRKAARLGAPLAGAVGRRFAMSLGAPLAAGAALTWGVWMHDDWALMPAVWLLLYGTGVLAGGVFSVAAVRLLGAAFMALGVAALATPPAWGNLWLGVGFGGLQLAFGWYIARRHGG